MSDRSTAIIPIVIIGLAVTLFILAMPFLVSGKVEAVPVSYYFEQNIPNHKPHHDNKAFSIMTLNIGHGRGSSLHQMIQSKAGITGNADEISRVIKREHIDITALQEVDGPGFWNGGLDLIEHLAETSGSPHGIWTRNVETPALSYGTAILSDMPYAHAESYTFKAKPFILPKGFTTGIFKIADEPELHVCIVSIHLAPLLPRMRKLQAKVLIDSLRTTEYPIIVAGDFNCGYHEKSAVKMIADELGLKAWKPEAVDLGTHRPGNRRLDWILVSEELEIIEYGVLKDRLSDHSAVRAVIRYRRD